MLTLGYLRVSTDEQDLNKQRHLLLEYAHQHQIIINKFIEAEVSSRKTVQERRITELQEALSNGDHCMSSKHLRQEKDKAKRYFCQYTSKVL